MMEDTDIDDYNVTDPKIPPGPDHDIINKDNIAHTDGEQTESYSEEEHKTVLISRVLELQNTLDELSQRVGRVKDENAKLKSENQVLTQYIDNLMASSTAMHGNASSKAPSNTIPPPPKKGLSSFFGLGGRKAAH
eukprot:CFRG6320T1